MFMHFMVVWAQQVIEFELSWFDIKRIVHPKTKFMSSFNTHRNVVPI